LQRAAAPAFDSCRAVAAAAATVADSAHVAVATAADVTQIAGCSYCRICCTSVRRSSSSRADHRRSSSSRMNSRRSSISSRMDCRCGSSSRADHRPSSSSRMNSRRRSSSSRTDCRCSSSSRTNCWRSSSSCADRWRSSSSSHVWCQQQPCVASTAVCGVRCILQLLVLAFRCAVCLQYRVCSHVAKQCACSTKYAAMSPRSVLAAPQPCSRCPRSLTHVVILLVTLAAIVTAELAPHLYESVADYAPATCVDMPVGRGVGQRVECDPFRCRPSANRRSFLDVQSGVDVATLFHARGRTF